MKKIILVIIILILLIAVVIIGIYLYLMWWGPIEYFCGHGQFGGLVGASDPQACGDEWEIIKKYQPLCQEMITNYQSSIEEQNLIWQDACFMVLQNPEGICLENMKRLTIGLTPEQEQQCLEKVNLIQ